MPPFTRVGNQEGRSFREVRRRICFEHTELERVRSDTNGFGGQESTGSEVQLGKSVARQW